MERAVINEIEKIENAVCIQFDTTPKELKMRRRFGEQILSRHMIIHIVHEMGLLVKPKDVMEYFFLDRACYYNSIKKADDLLKYDAGFRKKYIMVQEHINYRVFDRLIDFGIFISGKSREEMLSKYKEWLCQK